MIRRAIVLVLSLVALSACGDQRLTASGSVQVETADLSTEIRLPPDTRIDGGGGVTGSCQLTRSIEATGVQYGVVVDLFRGGAADNGLRSVSLMGRTDDPAGVIEANLGLGTFRSSAGCSLVVTSATDGGDVVLDAAGCALEGPDGATATGVVHLELVGCSIVGS